MGIIPDWDPFQDPSLVWAIAKVERIDPRVATWASPARVTLAIKKRLRGRVPSRLDVVFGEPREAGQARFYAERDLFPATLAKGSAELDQRIADLNATSVELPNLGDTIIVWLAIKDRGGFFRKGLADIPTLRADTDGLPMHSRWIEATDKTIIGKVRARLKA
jgi:hypothetical protein